MKMYIQAVLQVLLILILLTSNIYSDDIPIENKENSSESEIEKSKSPQDNSIPDTNSNH